MTRRDWILIGLAVALGSGLYVWKGSPLMAEQPFAARAAEIASRDALSLSPDELLTRLQQVAQDRPDDPEAHYHIALLMRAQARGDDAVRAFQSALRRDETHVPSLIGLADLVVEREAGEVGAVAGRLYGEAWRVDPVQTRAGFLAGLSLWRQGRNGEADAMWDRVRGALPGGEAERAQLDAMIAAARLEGDSAAVTP